MNMGFNMEFTFSCPPISHTVKLMPLYSTVSRLNPGKSQNNQNRIKWLNRNDPDAERNIYMSFIKLLKCSFLTDTNTIKEKK